MPFTDVFGGSTVQPSNLSYRAVALTANTTFSWPEGFDTDDTVARIMDITPSGAGLTITMPDATETTPGRDTLIRNLGAHTITIVKNDSSALTTVAAGESKYIYLSNNSTAAGTWSNVTFGTGTSSVDAATLVGYGIMASGNTLNQTHDVTEASNDFTIGESDRARFYSCTAGLTITLPSAVSTTAGFFFMLRNNGSGTVTVAKTGGDTIDAATSIALAPAESCFVCRLASSWVTVGRGRSAEFLVTQLTKSVAGAADVTLSSTEASNRILKFTGLLTGNINVIVPSVVAEYVFNNATTGSFTLTVKTAAGTGVTIDQNNQYVAYCDGVNVYNLPSSLPSGTVLFTDGSASAPSITFSSDVNTGFYRPGADQIGGAVGGASVLIINSSGINAALGATTPAAATVTTLTTTGAIELGNASDTTLARSAAGVMTIEGVEAVTLSRTQTLTNKTLTSPVITTPQINDTSADHQYVFAVSELAADRTVTLPLLTGNDEFVFKDHAVTLTNKTLSTGNVITGEITNSNTAAFQVSAGTTAQQPTGVAGKIRFNTDLDAYEGANNAGTYVALGGGATGGAGNAVFNENDSFVGVNYTIGSSAFRTCTFSNGSSDITMQNSFIAGQPVTFSTTGGLPTNFAVDTVYYVISAGLTSSIFRVSATDGGAAITAGSAGTGTQKCSRVKNANSSGPITIGTGITVTVPTGSTWTVV